MGKLGAEVKLAIVDPLGAHGGHHYYVNGQANAVADCGADVIVYNSRKSLLPDARFRHITAFEGTYTIGASKAVKGLRMAWGIVRSLVSARLNGCNVCLFHLFKHDGFEYMQVRLAKMLGMKTVCVIHDVERIDDAAGDGYVRHIHQANDLAVAHNDFSRQRLTANVATDATVAVIPHGNYVAQYPERPSMAEARAALGLDAAPFTLLFFGNPRETKGLHLLIEALALAKDPDMLLVVAGKIKPPSEERYRRMAADMGVTDQIRFDIKHVDDADLPYYFGAADLIVLPYTKIYESGVSIMAMSLARPVLVSDLPPLVETTHNGAFGMLFKVNDPADLAHRLAEAKARRTDLPAIGQRAFDHVCASRSWAGSGRALFEQLQRMVAQ